MGQTWSTQPDLTLKPTSLVDHSVSKIAQIPRVQASRFVMQANVPDVPHQQALPQFSYCPLRHEISELWAPVSEQSWASPLMPCKDPLMWGEHHATAPKEGRREFGF